MMNKLAEYRKALAAFLVPALTTVGVSLTAGSDGGTSITASEWVNVAIAALVTTGVVAAVRNEPQDADTDSSTFVPED